MGQQLNTRVCVDGDWYGPGRVPEHIAARITNPAVWSGVRPAATAEDGVNSARVLAAEERAAAAEAELAALRAQLAASGTGQLEQTDVDDDTPVGTAEVGGTDTGTGDGGQPSVAITEVQEPPRFGAGSGADVWRAFLVGRGVENVPADATRGDLVALWDARKVQG